MSRSREHLASTAISLMVMDGIKLDEATRLALKAELNGKDPVAFARKLLRVRAATRAMKEVS